MRRLQRFVAEFHRHVSRRDYTDYSDLMQHQLQDSYAVKLKDCAPDLYEFIDVLHKFSRASTNGTESKAGSKIGDYLDTDALLSAENAINTYLTCNDSPLAQRTAKHLKNAICEVNSVPKKPFYAGLN